eukprot:scaffold1860_cov403-Prasinococcus_capsulatus_cf.AAC.6
MELTQELSEGIHVPFDSADVPQEAQQKAEEEERNMAALFAGSVVGPTTVGVAASTQEQPPSYDLAAQEYTGRAMAQVPVAPQLDIRKPHQWPRLA